MFWAQLFKLEDWNGKKIVAFDNKYFSYDKTIKALHFDYRNVQNCGKQFVFYGYLSLMQKLTILKMYILQQIGYYFGFK